MADSSAQVWLTLRRWACEEQKKVLSSNSDEEEERKDNAGVKKLFISPDGMAVFARKEP